MTVAGQLPQVSDWLQLDVQLPIYTETAQSTANRFWWSRFGPVFAAEIRRKRAGRLRAGPQWRGTWTGSS